MQVRRASIRASKAILCSSKGRAGGMLLNTSEPLLHRCSDGSSPAADSSSSSSQAPASGSALPM